MQPHAQPLPAAIGQSPIPRRDASEADRAIPPAIAALLTAEQCEKLLANGHEFDRDPDFDPEPVVRLAIPRIGAAWLLCSLEPDAQSVAFGLCDLGCGYPELGSVSLAEIAETSAAMRLRIVVPPDFQATGPISAYAAAARKAGAIVELTHEPAR